jgi:hypothetical protein
MAKVVFLFGAGASANTLPMVAQIPGRLKNFIANIKDPALSLSEGKFDQLETAENKRQIQQMLLEDVDWLLELCEKHASVDTAAKKLYLKHNSVGLIRLKMALSVFLVAEQLNKNADYRYDAFFASLLKDSIIGFPQHVCIASWNYDYQFERSYQEYSEDRRMDSSATMLNVVTKFDYVKKKEEQFAIYKINGSTGLYELNGVRQYGFTETLDTVFDRNLMEKFVRNYAAAVYHSHQFYPGLSFAWEEQHASSSILPYIQYGTSNAVVLVVIGYSFPFFNREIDRQIIGGMKELKTVYFQAPDAENLIDRFRSVRPDMKRSQLIPIHDLQQFFLPPEL